MSEGGWKNWDDLPKYSEKQLREELLDAARDRVTEQNQARRAERDRIRELAREVKAVVYDREGTPSSFADLLAGDGQ